MVLVRFAYGFLNRLRVCSKLHRLCPFAPQALPCFITTTGCCPANSQAISCLLGRVHSLFALRLSLHGSFVPCVFAFFPALALSFCPIAALDWCDLLPSAFGLCGLDWFHDDICPQRQYPLREGEHLHFDALTLTSFHVGYSSVCSRRHPGHGCTGLLRYPSPSQGPFPLFTELHTPVQMPPDACRSIRDFVTPHTGSGRNCTYPFNAKFGFYS